MLNTLRELVLGNTASFCKNICIIVSEQLANILVRGANSTQTEEIGNMLIILLLKNPTIDFAEGIYREIKYTIISKLKMVNLTFSIENVTEQF